MIRITVYGSTYCGDCRRAKNFLREHGIAFDEVNIDDTPEAADLVVRVNNGRRKVPTIEANGKFFACSPFDSQQLAEELKSLLNS